MHTHTNTNAHTQPSTFGVDWLHDTQHTARERERERESETARARERERDRQRERESSESERERERERERETWKKETLPPRSLALTVTTTDPTQTINNNVENTTAGLSCCLKKKKINNVDNNCRLLRAVSRGERGLGGTGGG